MTESNDVSPNVDVSSSYTIPLDSIDLAYLGKYLQSPRAENIPLWTNQKLDGESEYCQVLIITKAKNEESYSEPSETYKCHICNVNVPRMYQQEHNTSDQHDTMKKIYQNVLESVSKQIDTNKTHDDQDLGDEVYYCAHCSKIIKLKNRLKHETSDYHVKSVNDSNIIKDFYKILGERKSYDESKVNEAAFSEADKARLSAGHETVFCEVNEARLSEGDETVSIEVDEGRSSEGVETLFSEINEARFSELNETVFSEENEESSSEMNKTESIEVSVLETDRFKENDYDRSNKEIEASFSSLDSDDYSSEQINDPTLQTGNLETKTEPEPSNEQEKESFEEYVKEMINKYNLKIKVPVISGDFIWMVAPNGTVVQVSRDHFHSYRTLMNNIYCQLCNKWITQDTRNHDVFEKHVKKVFRPINDKFTRWLDTISNHCVLCNEVVLKDSQHHATNDVHKNITEKTLCEDCNLYIDAHNFPVHLNSKKHLSVLMNHNSIEDINTNDIYCKICNQTVPKYALKFHINSKQHIKKKTNNSAVFINKTNANKNDTHTKTNDPNPGPSSPATSATSSDSEYCELCKVKIPRGGMRNHVNGKPHKKVFSEFCSDKSKNSKPETRIVGSTGSSVPNTDNIAGTSRSNDNITRDSSTYNAIPSTSNASDHVANKINAYKGMTEFIDQTRTHVRCKICTVKIINKENKISKHMEGRSHKENVNKQKIGAYNKLLFTTDSQKNKVKCQICNISMVYVAKSIIEHMEGRNHVDAENQLLKFHLITKESFEFVCACCGIQTTDYLDHINSRTHTLQFLQNYEIDKALMRKYVYSENINDHVAHRYRELYKNLLRHNGIYKLNEVFFFCGMCKIKLGRISEIDHVLGDRHGSKIEKINKLSSLLEQLEMANVIKP